MLVKVLFLFVLFGIFASNLHCVNGGRGHFSNSGRGKSSTSHRTYSSHSSRSNKPSWFSWFRSNKNVAASSPTTTAQKSTSPTFNHRSSAIPMQSRMGFSAYGNNYQSNFHHNPPYHFQPISQPYQSHFRPQTTTGESSVAKVKLNEMVIKFHRINTHTFFGLSPACDISLMSYQINEITDPNRNFGFVHFFIFIFGFFFSILFILRLL